MRASEVGAHDVIAVKQGSVLQSGNAIGAQSEQHPHGAWSIASQHLAVANVQGAADVTARGGQCIGICQVRHSEGIGDHCDCCFGGFQLFKNKGHIHREGRSSSEGEFRADDPVPCKQVPGCQRWSQVDQVLQQGLVGEKARTRDDVDGVIKIGGEAQADELDQLVVGVVEGDEGRDGVALKQPRRILKACARSSQFLRVQTHIGQHQLVDGVGREGDAARQIKHAHRE